MVIAVAEGAGQKLVATGKKDATGHTVYGDIGTYLKAIKRERKDMKSNFESLIEMKAIIRI